ncbi:7718_t:CDS:2, partial [Gigaspora margarita]
EVYRLQLQMQIMLDEIRPPIFEEWFDELRPPIHENSETCYVSLIKQCWDSKLDRRPSAAKLIHDEENEEFIYSSENHSDIDDLTNKYNTKSTSIDKILNIEDLINEYNNKPTSSEKLLILFSTKGMSLA